MEDLYVNKNFAFAFIWKSIILLIWVMSSFSELEFKWSVYVIDALSQLHIIHTWFSFEANDLFILWLW